MRIIGSIIKAFKMTVSDNLNKVLKDIEGYKPRIIAVTKYYDIKKMMEAFKAGLRDFAESRAKDSIEKINKIDDTTRVQAIYHFIGHLQTNKVKYGVGLFDYIHSVDSLKVAQCIDFVAKQKGIVQKVLLQVNNANETQKFGVCPEQLENLINEVLKMKNVKLEGLMNIAPLTDDIKKLQELFSEMNKLREIYNLKELSMGMSHDYKIAVENGATMIRLGRILFE